MANISPPKVLNVEVTSIMDEDWWVTDDYTDPWNGYPYKWRVNLSVTSQSHSDVSTTSPFAYTGLDIKVGDWLVDSTGISVAIVEIISNSEGEAELIVEDVERFNTFSDSTMSGNGSVSYGSGFVIEVSEDGNPILYGIDTNIMSPTFISSITSRFNYRNIFRNYVRVNQSGHSFNVGDVVRIRLDGTYELAQADVNVNAAIGVVNSIGIPSETWFTYRPFCKMVDNVQPDLVGNYGDIFYIDPANPGKLTKVRPETNARPIYIRLDKPTKALLLDAGMFEAPISDDNSGDSTHKYNVDTVTDNQTLFVMPDDATEVVFMSINGIENENFTFDADTKELIFDPVTTGYGVETTDSVFFIYKS